MKIMGGLDVVGEVSGAFKEYADFPKDPKVGTWARINRMMMVCSEMDDGTPIWLPMTPERDTHIHPQDTASTDWVIPHSFGIAEVIVQCYDQSGSVVIPSSITPMDENSTLVQFPQPVAGKAISMVGYTDGQAIATGLSSAMYSGRGAPLFESIDTGMHPQVMWMGLGKDGMIYNSGRNYYHSLGLGDGSPESAMGINLVQLPYYRSKVKDYGFEWGLCWVLFENGELWGWGYNCPGYYPPESSGVRMIPTKIIDNVDEVIQVEYSGYIYNNDTRRRILKMKDGTYKICGRAHRLCRDGEYNGNVFAEDLLIPEGLTYADIDKLLLVGNFERGCVYLQTKDKRHFIMGNNAYGQLGIDQGRNNSTIGWTELPQFSGKTIKNVTNSDGWGSSSADRSARYLHFTDGEVYYAGEGYAGYWMTGNELEDLPMDSVLSTVWTLIQTDVEEIHVTHTPCSVVMKQNGTWKQFGYSYEYQIEDTRSRNVMTPLDVPFITGDAELISRVNAYNYPYNNPVLFREGNKFAFRGVCNYGLTLDGGGSRTLQQWETQEFMLDSSPIKQAELNCAYESRHFLLLLLEDGSLYGIGYGGYDVLSGAHGLHNRATVASWRRLN